MLKSLELKFKVFLILPVVFCALLTSFISLAVPDQCPICLEEFDNDLHQKIALHANAHNDASKHPICWSCYYSEEKCFVKNTNFPNKDCCPVCRQPLELSLFQRLQKLRCDCRRQVSKAYSQTKDTLYEYRYPLLCGMVGGVFDYLLVKQANQTSENLRNFFTSLLITKYFCEVVAIRTTSLSWWGPYEIANLGSFVSLKVARRLAPPLYLRIKPLWTRIINSILLRPISTLTPTVSLPSLVPVV